MSFPRSLYQLPDEVLSNALRESVDEVRNNRDRLLPEQFRERFLAGSQKNKYDGAAGDAGDSIVPGFQAYQSSFSNSGPKSLEDKADKRPVYEIIGQEYYSKWENAKEGLPEGAVPILPVERDFGFGLKAEDFVFAVKGSNPLVGSGGQGTGRTSNNVKALQGRDISMSLFELQPGGENLPHYHPRAAELTYLIEGRLLVGFTDTMGNYFENYIEKGQGTIFPTALVHFQSCVSAYPCEYVSFLGAEDPGVMSLPRSLYIGSDQGLSNSMRESVDAVRNDRDRLIPANLREQFQRGSEWNDYDGAAGKAGFSPVSTFKDVVYRSCSYKGQTYTHGVWVKGDTRSCLCDDGAWVKCVK
eukprot:gb/GEZN01010416.1/.p1 GENE.gb/GEZN01010416.1/~~gb/GEZN01010416.1/.p1  ORF type:complete len:371 (-),score=54.85 gb/GEZN01010416.1/:128-1198(-)